MSVPFSVLKMDSSPSPLLSPCRSARLEQTQEEGGRKGREGGPACHVTPQGCQCPVVRVSGPRKLPRTARASPSDAESHLLRQRSGSPLWKLSLLPWQQWLRLRRPPSGPLPSHRAPGRRLPALSVLPAVPGQRRPTCQEQGAQRQLYEAWLGPGAPARPAGLTPTQRGTHQYH